MAKRFKAQPRAGGATPCCWSAVITGSDTRSYDLGLLGYRDWTGHRKRLGVGGAKEGRVGE
jgi:hypothetical protein